jgi:hypothetical protein
VRLYVSGLGTEQLTSAALCDPFDIVDELATSVVSPSGIAFSVFVGEDRTDRLHNGDAGIILAGDHLQTVSLALVLSRNCFEDLAVLVL